MRQATYAFLRWGVERGHLKPCYLPPDKAPEIKKEKRVGYPLTDAQILRLLESLPEGKTHDRWRFALQLMAVYGLRPEELRWLRVKDGVDGPELWSMYRKSKGGNKGERTDPVAFTRCSSATPMAPQSTGSCRAVSRSTKSCHR